VRGVHGNMCAARADGRPNNCQTPPGKRAQALVLHESEMQLLHEPPFMSLQLHHIICWTLKSREPRFSHGGLDGNHSVALVVAL